jgi:hypothetical protein
MTLDQEIEGSNPSSPAKPRRPAPDESGNAERIASSAWQAAQVDLDGTCPSSSTGIVSEHAAAGRSFGARAGAENGSISRGRRRVHGRSRHRRRAQRLRARGSCAGDRHLRDSRLERSYAFAHRIVGLDRSVAIVDSIIGRAVGLDRSVAIVDSITGRAVGLDRSVAIVDSIGRAVGLDRSVAIVD